MKKEITILKLLVLLVDLVKDGFERISLEELELLLERGKI